MRDLIQQIRDYTAKHPDLQQAHHFSFDVRANKFNPAVEYIVMGVNPGETRHDWDHFPKGGSSILEETSEGEFNELNPSRSKLRWINLAQEILGTCHVSFAEMFFWSSYDRNQYLKRFEGLAEHLMFCRDINKQLIARHRPNAIVFTGLGHRHNVAKLYGLEEIATLSDETKPTHRLVVQYSDGERPWFFTKHWSGAYGFSKEQRQQIAGHIRAIMENRSPPLVPEQSPPEAARATT